MPFFNNSSVVTANYQLDPDSLPISRSGLQLWARADNGITLSGNNVTKWADMSGSGNDLTQSVTADQPTIVNSAISGLPAVKFDAASSQFLQLPAGFADFTSGASLFLVAKPVSVTSGARLLDLGNGAASDNLYLSEPTSTGVSFFTYNGATSSSVTSSSAMTLNQFQLLDVVYNGSSTASIFTDGVQGAQGTSMSTLNYILRSSNFVGQGSAGGNFFDGQIAEIVLYNRALTASERAAVQGYLLSKYHIASAAVTPAPIISVAAGTLTAPSQVAIAAHDSAQIRFTVDGTTPSATTSPIYTKPIDVLFTQTVKAIAVLNGVSSSVSSAVFTLDATQWPAPGTTTTPLQLNLQLPSVSIPHDSNQP